MSNFNIYDIAVLKQAARNVEAIDTSVSSKAMHMAKVEEVRELIEGLKPINSILFTPDYYSPFSDYAEAVNEGKKKSKLDELLILAISKTIKTLRELTDIEYQTRDGRLIKNPVHKYKPHLTEWIEPSQVDFYMSFLE